MEMAIKNKKTLVDKRKVAFYLTPTLRVERKSPRLFNVIRNVLKVASNVRNGWDWCICFEKNKSRWLVLVLIKVELFPSQETCWVSNGCKVQVTI